MTLEPRLILSVSSLLLLSLSLFLCKYEVIRGDWVAEARIDNWIDFVSEVMVK
jgi:hypothetical protein